ncbi:hypothetical protein ACJ41O_001689 [Fusarium nematophilum]
MPDSNSPRLIAAMCSLTAVSLVFMVLRFICKGRYSKKFGWDDGILAFSWICLLLYAGLTVASTKYGIGRHIATIPPTDLVYGIKVLYIGEFFAVIAVAISKTSFVVTLLRLATQRWHRLLLWFIIITVNIVMWLCGLFSFIQCSPVEKLWDLSMEGTCWNPHVTVNFAIFAGSYSSAMDFLLSLFPWFLIWNLSMKKKEKIGVAVAMSLGVFAGITATIKTSYLPDIGRWKDFTFSSTDLLIWAASETAVTIIAASIPFFRLALKEVSQKSSKPRSESYYMGYLNTHGSATTGRE